MKQLANAIVLQFAFLLFFSISSWVIQGQISKKDFVQCLLRRSHNSTSMSQIIFTPKDTSYLTQLNMFVQNLRYNTSNTPKPQVIITPFEESQIQTAIQCSKMCGLQMRIRSGGHDFEGSSYVSVLPFFVLDMFNFRSISIDAKTRIAWVGAGASLGELYYAINQTKTTLAFPAGYFPTVCVGGHISGGGYGPLTRRHGLAADNVLDARIVDANGRILDRKSMGEDFFWAIRGGIGANFGIVLSYKLQLHQVPEKVTAFIVTRSLAQNVTLLAQKWQSVAPNVPKDLILPLRITNTINSQGKPDILATFVGVFHGDAETFYVMLQKYFPELGLSRQDLISINWIQFYPYFFGLSSDSPASFYTSRIPPFPTNYFKVKAEYIQKPIPIEGIAKILDLHLQIDQGAPLLQWTPLGGRNDEIPETAIPFPHRKGNSFFSYQGVSWNQTTINSAQRLLNWLGELRRVFGKYVEQNPRAGYADYRDLDLGVNDQRNPTVEQARAWGLPYFKGNFDRLVYVKTLVDPGNYFNNEQSIPPSTSRHVAT